MEQVIFELSLQGVTILMLTALLIGVILGVSLGKPEVR